MAEQAYLLLKYRHHICGKSSCRPEVKIIGKYKTKDEAKIVKGQYISKHDLYSHAGNIKDQVYISYNIVSIPKEFDQTYDVNSIEHEIFRILEENIHKIGSSEEIANTLLDSYDSEREIFHVLDNFLRENLDNYYKKVKLVDLFERVTDWVYDFIKSDHENI